jgi:hypothetical protein
MTLTTMATLAVGSPERETVRALRPRAARLDAVVVPLPRDQPREPDEVHVVHPGGRAEDCLLNG